MEAIKLRTAICVGFIDLILIVGPTGCGSPDSKFDAFQKDLKLSIDPKTIQDWAIPIINSHDVGYEIPLESFPSFLKTKDGPSSAFVSYCDTDSKAVFITWGGGFGHWGLIIGATNCVITSKNSDRRDHYWAPGASFFKQTR